MEVNLLEKTELWIGELTLEGADLNRIAEVVAGTLNIEREKVLVVDVRDDHVTLDILRSVMRAEDFYGKEKELLRRLSEIPGVKLADGARVHSDGILGMIALDEAEAPEVIARTTAMGVEIKARVARRACVFPTGFEVKRGMIRDTNTPAIEEFLKKRNFTVARGPILDDDKDTIACALKLALDEGYGLILTTGGVGAESKDRTVEAVLAVDPDAATPYLVRFQKGSGRHEKDGVRIAVGQVGESFIVSLPGPNDEVMLALKELDAMLEEGMDKRRLAAAIAEALRNKLKGASHGFKHDHQHSGSPVHGAYDAKGHCHPIGSVSGDDGR